EIELAGQGADAEQSFVYTFTFSNGKSYDYYDTSGNKLGNVASGGTITLTGEGTIVIPRIPDGITYTIVQADYAGNGYATDPTNLTHTGRSAANDTVEAKFVNTKYLPGKLTIGETVLGNGGDKNKPFTFTLTLDGEGANGNYAYTKSDH